MFKCKKTTAAVATILLAFVASAVTPYQLERDPGDQTAMRSGCTVFLRGHTGDFYKAMYCFDGNEGTAGDLYDNSNYNPVIGVDFGAAVYVSKVRVLTRPDNYEVDRIAGVAVYACNDAANFPATQTGSFDAFYASSVTVSDAIPRGQTNNTWVELECDSSVAYRYFYLWDRTDWQWFGNAAEIQFIGWTAEDVAEEGLPTDVTGIEASARPNGTVNVIWTCPGSASEFRLERKAEGEENWSLVATVDGSVKTYDDATVLYNTSYSYRVTAVYASENRVSGTTAITYIDPADFSVAASDVANAYATLAWDATGTFADGAKIYRKTLDGEWIVIATVGAGVGTYTDQTVLYGGIEYVYALGTESYGRVTGELPYVRLRKFSGEPVGWNYNHEGQTAYYIIDGDPATYCDIYLNGQGNPVLGMDVGAKVFVCKCRILPRQDANWLYRVVDLRVYGSNSETSDYAEISASGLPSGLETGKWYELECSTAVAYRYFALYRPSGDWNGNVAEVEFYGWTEADVAELSPVDVTGFTATSLSGGNIALAWDCAGNVSSFVVERKTGEGAYATIATLASGGDYENRVYTDATAQYGSRYTYRVTAVYNQFDATRVSSEVAVDCFEPVEFSVVATNDGRAFASLSWQNVGAFASGATILRKTAGGEWIAMGTFPAGTTVFVDGSVAWGENCEYVLAAPDTSVAISASVAFVRLKRLDGFTPVGFDFNHPGQDPAWIFDGNLSTYCDIYQNSSGNPALGADFGEGAAVHVGKVRLYPRQDPSYIGRLAGVAIYATPFGGGDIHDSQAQISYATAPNPEMGRWYELECDSQNAYRAFFLQHPLGYWWCGNVAEVEFYGWTDDDINRPFLLIVR